MTYRFGTTSRLIELWTLIVGELPAGTIVPDLPQLSCLLDAVACFAGAKRPSPPDVDDCLATYVLNPHTIFAYENGQLKPLRVPRNTVFVVRVRLDKPLPTFEGGEIVHWSLFVADATDPTLPQDYRDRLVDRRW